jgi:MFS family permease
MRIGSARAITVAIERVVGGPARTRVVVLFACVLALESADLAAVGAAGPQLRDALHISNTQLGLLAAISTLVGALATVPCGALSDRVKRVNLLAATIGLWGIAMLVSAMASSYPWLLLSRVGLGAVTAAAGPAVASLTGDFFAADERGRIYGYILSGELLGAGFGFVVSGSVAAMLSWRAAFAVLTVPAVILAACIWRALPEPARGGQSRLEPGATRIVAAEEASRASSDHGARRAIGREQAGPARRAVAEEHISAVPEPVLHEDPERMSLARATRYVLSIRTNRWLIVASAVGYLFFAGMRTFALVFVRSRFSLGQTAATLVLLIAGLGALAGVLIAGRFADRLIVRGRLDARIIVPAGCFVGAAILFVPVLLIPALAVAVPLLFLGGAALAAPNPPLDAARLDIVPSALWGRAEGVRTFVRQTAQAAAPVLFGLLADALGGSTNAFGASSHISTGTSTGVQWAFLIMLVPLAINGLAVLGARSSYPADVATAQASERESEAAKARRRPSRPVAAPPSRQGRGLTVRSESRLR